MVSPSIPRDKLRRIHARDCLPTVACHPELSRTGQRRWGLLGRALKPLPCSNVKAGLYIHRPAMFPLWWKRDCKSLGSVIRMEHPNGQVILLIKSIIMQKVYYYILKHLFFYFALYFNYVISRYINSNYECSTCKI